MAASVIGNAFIRNNIGNFGDVFDELYSAKPRKPKSLTAFLVKLWASHRHAARAHCAKLEKLMGRLSHKTADLRTNFVKEQVFGAKHGAPILSNDHCVMKFCGASRS